MYNNYYSELYHFGIKGMQWGKRRYQNEDGSLTPEGYIHYGRKSKRLGKTESHLSKAEDYGRNYAGYDYETRKAAAPLVGLGVGGYVGAIQMALGASAVESVLPVLGATVGGAAGFTAMSGAMLIGQQIVNKLLMHQHGKVSAQKKAIDSKLSQYEASSKKNKLNHSELYHFGILGQKWGVRRYQNKDGSLTPEGYEHYGHRKNNSNKVQRLVNDYKANESIKSIDENLKLSKRYGGDEAGTGLYIAKKETENAIIKAFIPNDLSNETISKLKKNLRQAEKDIKDIKLNSSKILDDSYKNDYHNEGYSYGYPKIDGNIHATVRKNDANEYTADLIDDHDGEYLGEVPLKKTDNGWAVTEWRDLAHGEL